MSHGRRAGIALHMEMGQSGWPRMHLGVTSARGMAYGM